MTQTDAVTDVLWIVVRALPAELHERFLEKMLADAAVHEEIEDLLDLAITEERSHESNPTLVDILEEGKRSD